MRLLLFILSLPLGASPIINSTFAQTTCHWIGGQPFQPDLMLTNSGGSGSTSSVSCPVNYRGSLSEASITVSGADVIAKAHTAGDSAVFPTGAQANAGFEVFGVAPQDGFLSLDFVTFWGLLTDEAVAQITVAFYFNGVQIGGFTQKHSGAGGPFQQETISNFVQPVQAGETYSFAAQAMAEAGGSNSAQATVEVQTATPEPGTIFSVGSVCLGFCLLRAMPSAIRRP
jgi:hypothetical protein